MELFIIKYNIIIIVDNMELQDIGGVEFEL